MAVAPLRNEVRDDLGRVLEIPVHRHDGAAGCGVEACGQCQLVTEVTRQAQDPETRVAAVEREALTVRPVVASVVDEDDLPRLAETIEYLAKPLSERPDRSLLVV
jgi:hypothetical protein